MALDTGTRETIESMLQDNKVVLFMKGTRQQPQCGFSATTVSTLDMLVSDYLTINVLEHPVIRDGIKEFGNWPTIPQLYIGGELIGGSDIVTEMLQSGELADVLGMEKPEVVTPEIHIGKPAIEAMSNALQSQAGMALSLQINAGWDHILSLAQATESTVKINVDGIDLNMDAWSAARANGLRIELEESLTGTHFSFDNPNAPPPVNQMTVQTLKEKLDGDAAVYLFDARSPEERDAAFIDGARQWDADAMAVIESLPKDTELIFHCHTGGRSQGLAEHIRRMGYTNLHNIKGGIQAWSEEIDPSVPKY